MKFKKELLNDRRGIRCFTKAQAKDVIRWYHDNGKKWETPGDVRAEVIWNKYLTTENSMYYTTVKGSLFWGYVLDRPGIVNYDDAIEADDEV